MSFVIYHIHDHCTKFLQCGAAQTLPKHLHVHKDYDVVTVLIEYIVHVL